MRLIYRFFIVLVLAACNPPSQDDGFSNERRDSARDGRESGSVNDGYGGEPGPADAVGDTPTGIRFLADGDALGFERAVEPRALEFPRDHRSHPAYRTEWWYFTGNLLDRRQRHYGFELTFFRIALAPEPRATRSAWATNQVWMAHFAVTDTARRRFIANERFARGAMGLAGAEGDPLRVWLENWSAQWLADTDETDIVQLNAAAERASLDLRLTSLKPAVLHGDRGLDAKGPEPGNASYYYSFPRLEARGTLTLEDTSVAVSGLAWMDREWSTSALSPGLEGWDWFGLQLSDGRDLMFYRLRNEDGTASAFSGGSLIDARGGRTALGLDDVELEILGHWRSARTGVRYPTAWRLAVPGEGIELRIEPYLPEQELNLSVRYWEGAVRATGQVGSRPVTANGYLELAGY